MEEEIERILNVTNFQDHPNNDAFKVFHFGIKEQADYFTELLSEKNIRYETDKEFAKGKTLYLFGIRKTDLSEVIKLNYLALGKYRKPLINNKAFKWFVLLFGFAIMAFATISYFMNN